MVMRIRGFLSCHKAGTEVNHLRGLEVNSCRGGVEGKAAGRENSVAPSRRGGYPSDGGRRLPTQALQSVRVDALNRRLVCSHTATGRARQLPHARFVFSESLVPATPVPHGCYLHDSCIRPHHSLRIRRVIVGDQVERLLTSNRRIRLGFERPQQVVDVRNTN